MRKYGLWLAATICGVVVGIVALARVAQADEPAVPTEAVLLPVLRSAGLAADTAVVVATRDDGWKPVVSRTVFDVDVRSGDERWNVTVDSALKLVRVSGTKPVPLPTGETSAQTVDSALRVADLWFQRLGLDLTKSVVYDVHPVGGPSQWRVLRMARWGADGLLQGNINVRIDAKTGALRDYWLPPDLSPPTETPAALVDQADAKTRALKRVAQWTPFDNRAIGAAQPLWAVRTYRLKQRPDGAYEPRTEWRVLVCGNGCGILGPTVGLRKTVWIVYVDDQSGEAEVRSSSTTDRAFVNGSATVW